LAELALFAWIEEGAEDGAVEYFAAVLSF
jgi:hypothetical protein